MDEVKSRKLANGEPSVDHVEGKNPRDFYDFLGATVSAIALTIGLKLSLDLVQPMGSNDYYAWLLNAAILTFLTVSIILTWIDLEIQILPTNIIYYGGALTLLLLISAAAMTNNWLLLVPMAISGISWFVLYGLVWYWVPKGLGFGDVRLSFFIGAFLGFLNPEGSIVGFVAAWIFPCIAILIALAFKKMSNNTSLPLGPWMLLGAFFGLFYGSPIVNMIIG